jgi:hypothetical protein
MEANEAAGPRRGRCQSTKRSVAAVSVVQRDRLAPALEKRAPARSGGIGVTVAGLSQSRSRIPNGSVRSALSRQSDAIFLRAHERIVRAVPELGASTPLTREIIQRVELQGNRSHPADYKSDSLSFNQAYFFRNFYKCLCVLNIPGVIPPRSGLLRCPRLP